MRNIILLGVIAAFLALAIRRPFIGLLAWAWFTLMTPHQLAYGVFGLPLNLIIAAVTIGAFVLSSEFTRFRFDMMTVLIIIFAGWLSISQAASLDADESYIYFDRFIKTLLFVVLCIQMTTSKLRIHTLVWVLVAGIGFFAAKGALFTLATLGEFRVQGLPDTIIEDNNHFALAAATILPLILYLRKEARYQWLRISLLALFMLTVLAVLGTHSRGGFVALLAFCGVFWFRSRYKFALAAALFALLVPAIAFMPAKWTERMATITEAAQDQSFMGRVDAWVINAKLAAKHPLTGAGLRNSYIEDVAATVDIERSKTARAAHSIYFEILGGAGIAGLAIFISMFAYSLFSCSRIIARRKDPATPPWQPELARGLQTSLIVFAVGGAAVSMEMWDGYLMIMGLTAALARMTTARQTKKGLSLEKVRLGYLRRLKANPGEIT
ncbi:MAG: putative O-glycosylation ligase, exosortase A system-associated [Pseudomonadota bacterium]